MNSVSFIDKFLIIDINFFWNSLLFFSGKEISFRNKIAKLNKVRVQVNLISFCFWFNSYVFDGLIIAVFSLLLFELFDIVFKLDFLMNLIILGNFFFWKILRLRSFLEQNLPSLVK